MNNPKSSALLFLLVALLAGAAIGITADRMLFAPRRAHHGREDFRKRMAEELDLTPTQKSAIDSLMMERHRQIVALFKPIKPQLDSISGAARAVSDSTHQQIRRLLNPEQQTKLEEMRAAARRDMEKSRHRWDSTAKSDSR